MHKLIATSTILEHELSELRLLVERQTGVVLDCPNSALAAHVADYVEEQGLGSSTTLLERVRSSDQDPSSLRGLLDGLVSVNTGFFRHPGALNALTRQVVPQLCARKSADGPSPLRIWSAGCGSGEETYSIAMAVCDALSHSAGAATNGNGSSNGSRNGNGKSTARNGGIADSAQSTSASMNVGLSIHIVGSDLLPHNIETADRGIYRQSALDGLPPATIRSYFSKISSPSIPANIAPDEAEDGAPRLVKSGASGGSQSAAHLLVKPRLRSLVTFN